jgi:hypothetical protein
MQWCRGIFGGYIKKLNMDFYRKPQDIGVGQFYRKPSMIDIMLALDFSIWSQEHNSEKFCLIYLRIFHFPGISYKDRS